MSCAERLTIRHGDITQIDVDAVVNAANSSLLGGGGVDGAIHRAGGPDILKECREIRATSYPDGLPAGDAVATSSGRLSGRFVIHTVGPVWHGGDNNEAETLAAAIDSCFRVARELAVKSIAFPAISTGVYGFPKEQAFRIILDRICANLDVSETESSGTEQAQPMRAEFVLFSPTDEALCRNLFERRS